MNERNKDGLMKEHLKLLTFSKHGRFIWPRMSIDCPLTLRARGSIESLRYGYHTADDKR